MKNSYDSLPVTLSSFAWSPLSKAALVGGVRGGGRGAGEGLVFRPSYESASCYGRVFGVCALIRELRLELNSKSGL